uniref:Uncharacterized protein LOC113788462 n=1 Tax=Dermatophagoides pteronyssinus TaxID=6956 RepID=A0A6P6XL74_DERPT|nr:uncharacterized protein LOC113788462 [Dermatophagoides pteronyssinus]
MAMVLNDVHEIHSPLIRTFVKFHGLFGVQLSPICWYDWHSILRLLINILMNIFVLYGLYIESNETTEKFYTKSHLYEHFWRASIVATYPIGYFITIICYIRYGHHIVKQLDSPSFQQIHIPVAVFFYDSSQLITWYILFYYQWIQYLSFRKLISKLSTTTTKRRKTNNNFSIEQRLFQSIKNLSQPNRQLQYYCSYLLIGVLIEQTNSVIHFLLYVLLDPYKSGVELANVFAQTIRTALCFLLVQINRKNIQFFDQIYQHFRLKFIGNHHNNHDQISIRYSKFNQLLIYRKYFQLSIFQWLNIDYLFLVHMFSFSLGYIIIISQTTD